jgi:Domain of unknown function (DUF4328)
VATASGVTPHHSFRSPGDLGRWLRILLGASAGLSVVTAIVSYGWDRHTRFAITIGRDIRPNFPSLYPRPIGALAALLGLATELTWLFWQHRVTRNVWARGRPIKTSPGWAVGWWFIPIANLWMPAVAVYRVFRASVGRGYRGGVWLISAWWTAYILFTLLLPGVFVATMVRPWFRGIEALSRDPNVVVSIDLTRAMHEFASWSPVVALLQVSAAVLAITIVARIDDAQESMEPSVPPRPDIGPVGGVSIPWITPG